MDASKQKFYGLDHLRALAITLVFFYHYRMFGHPAWVDTYARFGWMGVDLFFVLSGFLISSQLFRELKAKRRIRFKIFYTKRFLRIIPPFVVVLLLYYLLPAFREREALPPVWKFVTFTQNFGLDVIHFGTFSHAWSLCIEEQFYLLLPLALLFLSRSNLLPYLNWILLLLFIGCIVTRFIAWQQAIVPFLHSDDFWRQWYMQLYYPTYTRLDGLIVGVFIGYVFVYSEKAREMINRSGNVLLLLSVFFIVIACMVCNQQASQLASVTGFAMVAIGFGLLVSAAISNTTFLYKYRSAFTTQLANWSYAIYLSHKGIVHLTQKAMAYFHFDTDGHITLVVCIITCILTGLLFRYAIEKPSKVQRMRYEVLSRE